jgi:hypothetical protein
MVTHRWENGNDQVLRGAQVSVGDVLAGIEEHHHWK